MDNKLRNQLIRFLTHLSDKLQLKSDRQLFNTALWSEYLYDMCVKLSVQYKLLLNDTGDWFKRNIEELNIRMFRRRLDNLIVYLKTV